MEPDQRVANPLVSLPPESQNYVRLKRGYTATWQNILLSYQIKKTF